MMKATAELRKRDISDALQQFKRWRRRSQWSRELPCRSLPPVVHGPPEPEWENSMIAIRIVVAALCLGAFCARAVADDPLSRAKPEDVGLSSERLARIGETLKADIEAGRIP